MCFTLFWSALSVAHAQQSSLSNEDDSLRISLLTCSPGQEVYALYGHTAIRVRQASAGIDEVYNYGLFDFNSEHFIWRFALGQTDYYLGKTDYARFEMGYLARGSYITEQVLNLTPEEAKRLWQNLNDTLYSANRMYRYNYFYKNCSSMARDQILQALDGRVDYGKMEQLSGAKTFRQIIHEYTTPLPWNELSQDLLLGYGADTAIDLRLQQFAPEYLLNSFAEAQIHQLDGSVRPLVAMTQVIGVARPHAATHAGLHPTYWMLLLIGLWLLLCYYEGKKQRTLWGWDVTVLLVQGLLGIFVTFMVVCSEHPTVDANWVIMLLNPLPLLYLPRYIYLQKRGHRSAYHLIGMAMALGLLLTYCLQCQAIPLPLVLLALHLLLLHSRRHFQQRKLKTRL